MAQADYVAAVLSDSPKAFWKCQEASGNPADSSSNGNNMTSIIGVPSYSQSGPIQGSDSAIEFPAGAYTADGLLSTVVDNMTMELWFRPVSGGSDIIFYNGNGPSNGWGIYYSGPKFFFVLGGLAFGPNSSITLSNGTWYHIAMLRDAGTWRYYANGALDSTPGAGSPNAPSGGSTRFGPSDGAAQERIAYVALYETVLSPARIAAHYDAALLAQVGGTLPHVGGRGAV